MEYLMTYGWAILVVAVVLGALYSLGIFNGANFLGGTCVAAPGYLCTNPLLRTDGILNFTFGYQGPNVTIAGFACSNSSVAPSSFASSGSSDLEPGQQEDVGTTCTLSSDALGTQFSGYLWVEYDQAGQSDLIARFATIGTTVEAQPPNYQLYIATNCGGNCGNLYIMDTSDGSIEHSYYFNAGPFILSVSPDGKQAFLPSVYGTANIISTSNGVLIGTIPNVYAWPGTPVVFSPSGDYAYEVSGNYGVVAVTTSNDVVVERTASYGGPFEGFAISPDGKWLYLPSYNSGAGVEVVSTSNYINTANIPVGSYELSAEAVTPNGAQLFVATSTSVYAISTSTDSVSATIPGGYYGGCGGTAMAASPDGKYIYVADGGTSVVNVISTSTDTVVHTITAGLPGVGDCVSYQLAVSPDGSSLYIDGGTDTITVVDTSTYKVINTFTNGGLNGATSFGFPGQPVD
jgi:YVTN family beta-propeller protein